MSVADNFNRWGTNAHPLQRCRDSSAWETIGSGVTSPFNYKFRLTTGTSQVVEKADPFVKRVALETGLWWVLHQMDQDGIKQLRVVIDSRIVGMLNREDVITFLRTLQELGA
jgi:hypothetical protein